MVKADVAKILGLDRKDSKHFFDEYRKFMRDIKLAIRVAELYEFGEAKQLSGEGGAYQMVADESGQTERVVKEAYLRFNKQE